MIRRCRSIVYRKWGYTNTMGALAIGLSKVRAEQRDHVAEYAVAFSVSNGKRRPTLSALRFEWAANCERWGFSSLVMSSGADNVAAAVALPFGTHSKVTWQQPSRAR